MKEKMQRIGKHARSFLLVFFLFFAWSSVYAESGPLIPVGKTVGVTLDMEGVTVIDTTDVKDKEGKRHTPAKDAGIKSGDTILSINEQTISSQKDLEDVVHAEGENTLRIKLKRKEKEFTVEVQPVWSDVDGKNRIGIYVRDEASGIGTLTYYDPTTKEFGALGHGICDGKEEDVIEASSGKLFDANVVSIQKGEKGQPGELLGVFSEADTTLGTVTKNTLVGIKGVLTECSFEENNPVEVAKRCEVTEGEAEILSNIEGDKIWAYQVKIEKINKDTDNTKGMILCVTDETLLAKTGGIVQGMSGSPILQNGKIVGAVTHVFVNDPTRGYGIFIENMLSEAEKISD